LSALCCYMGCRLAKQDDVSYKFKNSHDK
jgi:hypothetical protein